MHLTTPVSRNAFIFCRYSLMLATWLAFFLRSKETLLFVFIILTLSAILKVKRSPFVYFYESIERLIAKKQIRVLLDEEAMRFAHILGAALSGYCCLLLYTKNPYSWYFVFGFAIIKTISAVGLCPAAKLYSCMKGGSCCRFLK